MAENAALNDGKSCPGETACGEDDMMPLGKYGEEDTDATCRSCPLFDSKPERIPDDVMPFAARAFELDHIRQCGGTFAYPYALTAVEWATLASLASARERGSKRGSERRDKRTNNGRP